jgi:hypothetical protein
VRRGAYDIGTGINKYCSGHYSPVIYRTVKKKEINQLSRCLLCNCFPLLCFPRRQSLGIAQTKKSLQLNLLFFTRPTGENTEGLISVPAGMHVSGSNIGVGEVCQCDCCEMALRMTSMHNKWIQMRDRNVETRCGALRHLPSVATDLRFDVCKSPFCLLSSCDDQY